MTLWTIEYTIPPFKAIHTIKFRGTRAELRHFIVTHERWKVKNITT